MTESGTRASPHATMGLDDGIADSPADYVARAVALGTDRAARSRVSGAIAAASGVLFENAGAVRQLEDWFEQALRG